MLATLSNNADLFGYNDFDWLHRPRADTKQWCHPKTVTRGQCCRKYVDHAFNQAHSCLYDNNMLVKPMHVDFAKESLGL